MSNPRVIAESLDIEAMDTVRGEEAMDYKVWARGEEDYKRFSIHGTKTVINDVPKYGHGAVETQ